MSSPITIELEPKSIASCEPPEELKFLANKRKPRTLSVYKDE
jgi:hypothetical protein